MTLAVAPNVDITDFSSFTGLSNKAHYGTVPIDLYETKSVSRKKVKSSNRSDPLVVSAGNPVLSEYIHKFSKYWTIKSQNKANEPIRHTVETVLTDINPIGSTHNRFSNLEYFRSFLSLQGGDDESALANNSTYWYHNAIRAILQSNLAEYEDLNFDWHNKFRSNIYNSVVRDILKDKGFEAAPSYQDELRSEIVDYVRNTDRITIVITEEAIQVLSHINGDVASKSFSNSARPQANLRDYIEVLTA